MQAKDVMNPDVVSVSPNDTVRDLAATLVAHGISAAPVIDNGKLVGIVSEGDLVRRTELGTAERPRSWWLQMLTEERTLASEYVKANATHVRDVMSENVMTVSEDTSLTEVAKILETKRIKRVPIMRGDQVVGILSRGDLVQQLAATTHELTEPEPDDAEIRVKVLDKLREQSWTDNATTNVIVRDGTVEIFGLTRSKEERDAGRVAAGNVPGVHRVEDHRIPDTTPYGEH